jgi:chromosome segregation ATPase
MEDKTFELVTQLYSEMTKQFELMNQRFEAIDQRFDAIDQRFEAIDHRFETIDQRFEIIEHKLDRKADASDIVRLENTLVPKVDALLDGYKQLSEKQNEICTSIHALQVKVMQHDVQIAALQAAK